MTDEQARDWEYRMICCLGISTSNSDINVVALHKTVKELYEQGRADEREAQVCCGDYEKCIKACTPRGRWLAEKELTKPKQEPVCDKDPFYCWSIRCQVGKVCKHTAQPEQKLNDPPDYVEPPTSDYHNGWEEGFEAAKNLFKKESAPQNADPRLLLGRKDNCTALAQPEQEHIECGYDETVGMCTNNPCCEQTPIAHLWECIGRWSSYLALNGEKANLAPPEWLVDAVKAATAQPEQEPVAKHICNLWINPETSSYEVDRCTHPINEVIPVYTAPPRKEWVGLTGLELNHVYAANVGYPERMCLAIEAKLKEKNNAV